VACSGSDEGSMVMVLSSEGALLKKFIRWDHAQY
jgi:hypothetical protein